MTAGGSVKNEAGAGDGCASVALSAALTPPRLAFIDSMNFLRSASVWPWVLSSAGSSNHSGSRSEGR